MGVAAWGFSQSHGLVALQLARSCKVGKVSPGSFAERTTASSVFQLQCPAETFRGSKIQTGQLLVALNGTQMKELNAETFKLLGSALNFASEAVLESLRLWDPVGGKL